MERYDAKREDDHKRSPIIAKKGAKEKDERGIKGRCKEMEMTVLECRQLIFHDVGNEGVIDGNMLPKEPAHMRVILCGSFSLSVNW